MDFQVLKTKYQHKEVEEYANNVIGNPLVSVCVQTFQHVNYIKECLDGVLNQETDFAYEILIGEDQSTDGTREICIEYANKHPDKIRLFLHLRENNITIAGNPSGRFNFLYNLYSAHGKYIALCEGDDYWTDPLKLQKQINFLEENPQYSLTYHRALESGDKTRTLKNQCKDHDFTFDFLDSLQGKHGTTLSMVFRKEIIQSVNNFTEIMDKIPVGDWPLECLCTLNHAGYFMNEVMGSYRVHGGGVSNSLNREKYYMGRVLFASRLLKLPVAKQHQHIIKSFLFRIYLSLLYYCLVNTHWSSAFDTLQKIFKFIPPPKTLSLNWEPKFNKSRLIARLPIGLIIGFKNTLFGIK